MVLPHNITRPPRVYDVLLSFGRKFHQSNKAGCEIPHTPSPNQERAGDVKRKLVCQLVSNLFSINTALIRNAFGVGRVNEQILLML